MQNIKHDGIIQIATGMSARSRVWKNKKWKWSKIVDKLITANPTNETAKEYAAASKDDRSKIKDVGGYVGGYLRNGRRKPENVVHRQLITLDIDFAHDEIWFDFELMHDCAAVLHATHSHTAENPKYRLIIPLSREVTPDEYVAIGRRIAGDTGIEYFDSTGFQPYRLMFWPSNPSDMEYYAKFQDGKWLDADAVLDSYADWTDSSLWPTDGKQFEEVGNLAKKQQDPETKKGIIGAFCRTYTMSEAITEFLSEQYVEAGEDRYTYTLGSTAGGLIVYDDKFAYSHHGTDPCGGKLCNVFDLVRLHRFEHLDNSQNGDTTKKASYKAMEQLAREDRKVRRTLAEENLQDARYDFAEGYEDYTESEDGEPDLSWAEDLEVDGRGKYISSATNLNLIFQHDPRICKAFRHNEFDNKRYLYKSVPWRNITEPEPLRNVDYSGVRNYIESMYNIVGVTKIDDAMALEFERNLFHPIRDYLADQFWDGTRRVDTLLIDYFGAPDTPYHREAIRKTLCAAVARVRRPGVKFDTALTLVGVEGTGKSTFAAKLGGVWFSDSFMTVHGKEAYEQLQGAWIMEMAELSGLRKAEAETVKHFMSKQKDSFRPAYGRVQETYKRQCIFIGTTNKDDFLISTTGNRRFWPVKINPAKVTESVFDMDQDMVDQIWAEAVEMYEAGETLYLSESANGEASERQKDHGFKDERTGIIERYLDTKLPTDWDSRDSFNRTMYIKNQDDPESLEKPGTVVRDTVCMAEIWTECLELNKRDMDRYKTRQINDILRNLDGWEQVNSTKDFTLYGRQRYFRRIKSK